MVEIDTFAGSLLLPRDDVIITRVLTSDRIWEPAESRWLMGTLRPGQTFVDVGAHVGYFSVLAAKCVGPTGMVIAVEPEPRNLDLLRRNLVRNGATNTRVVPFAAAATEGQMSLALDEQNRGGHCVVPLGEAPTVVRCVALDDVLPKKVDVVKVDAQGYDHEVIEGLRGTLTENPHLLAIVEVARTELDRRGVGLASVLARYKELGFKLWMFDREYELRNVAADDVLTAALHRTDDFSVVLWLARDVSDDRSPVRADGLEVDQTESGLIVRESASGRDYWLNPTAAAVFDLCTGKHSVNTIIETMQEIYKLPEPPATEVARCIDQLRDKELVTWRL